MKTAVLGKLDGFLCDLKDLQIRDGLHIFGCAPTGAQHRDLALALARPGFGDVASYIDALAQAEGFDGLPSGAGSRLRRWRSNVTQSAAPCPITSKRWKSRRRRFWMGRKARLMRPATAVFDAISAVIFPLIAQSTTREIEATLTGLSGRFVPAWPVWGADAPTARCLPTGRNFYSVDTRSVPTQAAWRLGLEVGVAAG